MNAALMDVCRDATEDESKVFQEEGSVAILEDPPEDEQPPDYPSPAENR